MNKLNQETLRLVFDFQTSQPRNTEAGCVINYTSAFLKSILEQHKDCFTIMRSDCKNALPDISFIPPQRILNLPTFPNWHMKHDYEGGDQDTIDAILYSASIATLKPDVIHVSNVFQGFEDRCTLPNPGKKAPGQIISATLFDLDLLHFPEKYFQDINFKKWYMHKLNWLTQIDLVLTASESTRQDVIQFLKLDSNKVVNLQVGVPEHFKWSGSHESSQDGVPNSDKLSFQQYSCDKSATIAIEAFKEVLSQKRKAGMQAALGGWLPRMRMAFLFSPSSCKTMMAEHDHVIFLRHVSRYFDIDLYVDKAKISSVSLNSAYRIYNIREIESVANSYDVIFYDLGSTASNTEMITLLEKFPGVVRLNDFFQRKSVRDFAKHSDINYQVISGKEFLEASEKKSEAFLHQEENKAEFEIMMAQAKSVIECAIGIISHTFEDFQIACQLFPEGWRAPFRLQNFAEYYNPTHYAAEFAALIQDFINKEKLRKPAEYIPCLGSHLSASFNKSKDAKAATQFLNNLPNHVFAKRRLFIDVSKVAAWDYNTGIQRVVKKIVLESYQLQSLTLEPYAVELKDGTLKIAYEWLKGNGILSSQTLETISTTDEVVFNSGDVLLMLDSSWSTYFAFYPIFDSARRSKVAIYSVIYDILPITLPQGMSINKTWFENWILDATRQSDGLICISKAVADEVIAWGLNKKIFNTPLKIGYWHLGCDVIDPARLMRISKKEVNDCGLKNKKYLLMVGTLEPRKNHELALSAMELLWKENSDLCLCIAGKVGGLGKINTLVERLRNHHELGKRLFFLEAPSDEVICKIYSEAAALLFIPINEGFGLPLVEAAHYGIQIICSDIPVFREVAGGFATYLNIENHKIVAQQLSEWYEAYRAGKVMKTSNMPRLTWQKSVSMLQDLILNDGWYWQT